MLIAAGLMLAAGAAPAQTGLDFKVVSPMTDKQIAAARAAVDAALAKARVAPLFENVTDASGGKARHRASGLVCPLGRKGQRIVSATADAAQCETTDNGNIDRTSVVRAPDGATLDSVSAATRAAAEREPHYAPATGAQVVAMPKPGSGLPEHRTFRFVSKVDGRERASHLEVGLVRGWVLTERHEYASTSTPPLGMIELLQEAMFGSEMKEAGSHP